MKTEDIILGKKYRIRDWYDMEREFGLRGQPEARGCDRSAIDMPYSFVPDMECLCKMVFTPEGWGCFGFEYFINGPDGWTITPNMLEEIGTKG